MKAIGAKSIGSLSLIVLLFSTILVFMNSASPVVAEADTATSTSSSGSDEVAAASGSNRFVVWTDNTPGNAEIFFRRSTDNGATWQPTVNLSTNPGGSYSPQIVVSGSNVYVAWLQYNSDGEAPNLFFRRSTDNGATWGAKIIISSSGTVWSSNFELAASGSNVCVVWQDVGIGEHGDIFLRRSTDGGATWKAIVNVSNNFSTSLDPDIAVSGSNVYVVWSNWGRPNQYEIFFRRSLDGGANWQARINISENPTISRQPEIAASGSNVYVTWPDARCLESDPNCLLLGDCFKPTLNCDILFRGSANNGEAWTSVKNLSNTPRDSVAPQFAVSGSNVYLVWGEERADKDGSFEGEIHFRRSTDGGATWKPIVNLSNNPGHSAFPQIAISSSNLYVVWDQDNVDHTLSDAFFRRSTDNGATWKPVKNLSNTGHSIGPDVAASGSSVYAAWTDFSPADVWFQRSTDNGATWKSLKNLSNTGSSSSPQIAV